MPVPFAAYHGVTGAQHQTNFNKYSSAGFRMISLSVYGSSSSPRYAAVWTKESGPAYAATHGINAAQYQAFFNTWTAKGYTPKILSATGAGSSAIFAAVFEKVPFPTMIAKHGLTKAQFDAENASAKTNNLILHTFAAYGSSSARHYAGVWVTNTQFVKWLVYSDLSSAEYQKQFNACIQLPWYSPDQVSVFEDNHYCAMFTDRIRGQVVARHNISPSGYQTAFNTYTQTQFIPYHVDAGGQGNSARFAVMFASTHKPFPRTWRTHGTGTTATNGLDAIMQAFMKKHAIRYAQLCLGKGGVIKYNKAFTWAESNYKTAANSDRFMLASCSKLFVHAAIDALIKKYPNSISMSSKAYGKLGFSSPKDSRSDDITIKHLLEHKGGFDADTYDSTYDMRDVATALGLTKAITKTNLATYMYKKRNLKNDPGDEENYCNFGSCLLSLVVEKISGKDYFAFLKAEVLDKIGVTEVKVWPTVANTRSSNEVATESSGLGLSAVAVTSDLQVPNVYGGDGMIKEVAAGSCGIASSAHAMVQTIRHHAVWGTGGRANGSARAGSTPGSSTLAVSNGDNMDWAYTINTREFVKKNKDDNPLKELGDAITKFLSDNKAKI
ncbi:serine hydrolase [Algoriphagus terrigena]|uniref:serine hydrolase n=1 Tax=Algoriphagus terrigena TaxID=344884 RepID=UPI0012FC3307|nr:serine hydrolase [Algoriphagus terrigena]